MKITLDISKLVEDGKLTAAEAERLKTLASHETGSFGINILVAFGVIAVAAGAVALVPAPATAVLIGLILFAAGLAKYGETDLVCYRAESPTELVERQAAEWDPLLAWARRRFDVDFSITAGITHVAQPESTVARLSHAVAMLDPFRLAALAPMVTVCV